MQSLLTLFAACASAPLAPSALPRMAEQVSSADWEQDIQRFEVADPATPPPKRAVLFIGSSSIRFWDRMTLDFPGVAVINRGFGGSKLRDSTWYADRIVIPSRPRKIVLYAGDNNLASGRSPVQVQEDFRAFVERVRRDLPDVEIAYLAGCTTPGE